MGAVLGGWGRWRSIKRVEFGVRKVEMWEEANWSIRLRYLQDMSPICSKAIQRRRGEVGPIHLVIGPLHLIHEIQATVYDERIHEASLLTESGDTISTLLGRAEFELK